MSDQVPATECEGRAHVLDKCVESFLTKLSGLGYATATIRQKRAMVEYFARWVVHRRFDIAEIDERVVGAFHVHLGRRRIPMGNWRCTTKTFLEHLRGEALTARPEETVRDDSREGHLLLSAMTPTCARNGARKGDGVQLLAVRERVCAKALHE